MKLFSVVLFAGLVAFVCAQDKEDCAFTVLLKQCSKDNGIDLAAFKRGINNPNADSKVGCTFSCICERLGVMKADGSPNRAKVDDLMERLGERAKPAKPLIDMCIGSMKAGLPKCESAWSALKCVQSKMGKRKQ